MAIRAHANRNPAALMYEKTMSLDDYMAARFISEPLCLFDNCLETDGALAVVLVSAERAKDCPTRPRSCTRLPRAQPGARDHGELLPR